MDKFCQLVIFGVDIFMNRMLLNMKVYEYYFLFLMVNYLQWFNVLRFGSKNNNLFMMLNFG